MRLGSICGCVTDDYRCGPTVVPGAVRRPFEKLHRGSPEQGERGSGTDLEYGLLSQHYALQTRPFPFCKQERIRRLHKPAKTQWHYRPSKMRLHYKQPRILQVETDSGQAGASTQDKNTRISRYQVLGCLLLCRPHITFLILPLTCPIPVRRSQIHQFSTKSPRHASRTPCV